MTYLFLVTIGPVQSFIASARRTRDLWFGSTLLSELSKTAARTIADKGGILIFPMLNDEELRNNSESAVASKVVAYIEISPDELGKLVYESLQDRLTALKEDMYSRVGQKKLSEEDRAIANRQIAEMLECLWVAVPFQRGTDDYATMHKHLENLLAARKNTRNYSPVPIGSSRPKSSIDGRLESVIPEHYFFHKKARELYEFFHAGPAERLSGVDLLKRRARFNSDDQSQEAFLSTSHLAAIPYLKRLETLNKSKQEAAKQGWKSYITTIQETIDSKDALLSVLEKIPSTRYKAHSILERYDGALLFEERLREDFPDPDQFRSVRSALHNFFKNINENFDHSIEPHPYYAILRADGDGMSKLIKHQTDKGPDFSGHQRLSELLIEFAGRAKTVVEDEHWGTLLYSGGDDVLAFLPLYTALSCARELSQAFKATLKELLTSEDDKNIEPPSLSVGISIVHHLSLLREALRQSKDTEDKAKDVDGKDALAITLYRRSGEEYSVAGKLEALDRYLMWLTPYFMPVADQPEHPWQRVSLPKGTAYELRATALRLTPYSDALTEKEREDLQEVLKADILRILQRKLKASSTSHSQEVQLTIKQLLCIFKKHLGVALHEDEHKFITEQIRPFFESVPRVDIHEFINEFIIAHELADTFHLSGQKRTDLQKGSFS